MGKAILYQDIESYINSKETGNECLLLTNEEEFEQEKIKQDKSNSKVNIKIQCKCKNIFETNYNEFKSKNKKQCNNCGKNNGSKKQSSTYDDVKKYVEKNNCKLLSEEYINSSVTMQFQCKCGNPFETTFKNFKFGNKQQCNMCGEILRKKNIGKTNEQFLEEVFEKIGNEYSILEKYTHSNVKIKVRHNCKKCNNYEFDILPSDLLNGIRCSKCYGNLRKNTDQFKIEIYDIVQKEYTVLGEYKNNRTNILMKHNICGHEWYVNPKHFLNGSRCPKCNESKGEVRISEHLIKNNINYIPQQEFSGLIGLRNGNLSYDFYLPQYNLLIEYQGEQHEKYVKGFHKSKKDFEKQQEHDSRKREYAKEYNIKLLEIWYWDFDNIEEILDIKVNIIRDQPPIV